MLVTVTYIKLKNPFLSFKLTMFGYKIMQQTKQSAGFITMKNKGFWNDHYTLSAWQTIENVKAFAQSGEHLTAMKQSKALSHKIITYTYSTEQFPDWKTAIALLHQNGKTHNFK